MQSGEQACLLPTYTQQRITRMSTNWTKLMLCAYGSFTDADTDCLTETLTAAIDGTLIIFFL